MRKGTTIAALVALLGLFTLAGCGEKTNEEKAQDAVDGMEDAADDAANDMENALEQK